MTPQQQQQQQQQQTEEAPSSWRAYPAGINGHNAITTTPPGKRSLSDRLSGLGEVLFCDEIDFRVVDIRSENGRLAPPLCVLRMRGTLPANY